VDKPVDKPVDRSAGIGNTRLGPSVAPGLETLGSLDQGIGDAQVQIDQDGIEHLRSSSCAAP
jgi:hypothetical protein